MATEPVTRHPRRVRWLHATVALTTLVLVFTGGWLLAGEEGHPRLCARRFGVAVSRVHVWAGRVLALVALVAIVVGWRGARTFVRETFRYDRGDVRWWRLWPLGAITGRFARHEGTFDPGQRVA